MSIVQTTKFKFPKLKQKYRMQQKYSLNAASFGRISLESLIMLLITQKEPQYVEQHTIQIQRTVKVTAWRRRPSYQKSNNI